MRRDKDLRLQEASLGGMAVLTYLALSIYYYCLSGTYVTAVRSGMARHDMAWHGTVWHSWSA